MKADVVKAALCAGAMMTALGGVPAAAQSDPLAPAREGRQQCYLPNAAQKTCASLGVYTFDAQGGIQSGGEAMIMPSPLIVMTLATPVVVRDGAVCGPLHGSDLDRATFTINGAPASAEDSANIRAAMREQMAAILDEDVCTTFTPVEGGFRADAVINGAPHPELSQPVIWVRPGDGWRVAP